MKARRTGSHAFAIIRTRPKRSAKTPSPPSSSPQQWVRIPILGCANKDLDGYFWPLGKLIELFFWV